MDESQASAILDELESGGIFQEVRLTYTSTEKPVLFLITARLGEYPVRLKIYIPTNFPRSLPSIYLEEGHAFAGLPHVMDTNFICYQSSEGLVVDKNQPAKIIQWAIEKTLLVLSDGKTGANQGDYADEFEVYWSYICDQSIINLVNPSTTSQDVKLFKNRDSKVRYLASSVSDLAKYLHLDLAEVYEKFPTVERSTFFVLPQGTVIVPPRGVKQFWSINELKHHVQPALDCLSVKQTRQLIKKNTSANGTMVFALPRPNGGFSLFGVSYVNSGGFHPLSAGANSAILQPVNITRQEATYILPRGGSKTALGPKRVLLLGCGAIGGHIAHELVRAGILQLTLVDSDTMSLENTFRHVLGNAYCGRPKASALREELNRKFPYTTIVALDESVDALIEAGTLRLTGFDLVISALGSPTLEIWLSEQIMIAGKTPALFGWVEPLGIGGHALLAIPGTPGCFTCLYRSADPEDSMVNRAAFAGKNQWFGKSLSGCGHLHTPYGSLDASRTANLVVQLALQALSKKVSRSTLLSWKGDATEFLNQGYVLSERFGVSEELLTNGRHSFASPACSICQNLLSN